MANIAMLGTDLIGMFYTMALTGEHGRDRIRVVCGHREEETRTFAEKFGMPDGRTKLILKDKKTGEIVQRLS